MAHVPLDGCMHFKLTHASFFAVRLALFLGVTVFAAGSVTVTSPSEGSTVTSSVHVVSTSASTQGITRTMIYLDNKVVYNVASKSVDTNIAAGSGNHALVVQSWDTTGTVTKSSRIHFTVSSSGTPGGTKNYTDINRMGGWDSCDKCAGAKGDGATAVHVMSQNISSPALDGKSAEFYLRGSKAYSNALWWKQLGANPNVSNFTYDLYFYLKNPSAAQALEFDVNQSLGGKKYIFGTECDIKGKHAWMVYNAAGHAWTNSGVACTMPAAYTWNHLTLEFQRANGQVKFVSVTLNGKKSYFNRSYGAATGGAKELNVAVQIDGDGQNTAYSEWADKINLSTW